MKTQEMKTIISRYVDKVPNDIDLTDSVISRLKAPKRSSKKMTLKTLLIAASLLVLTSMTFATVINLIELRGKDETIKEIVILEEDFEVPKENHFVNFSEESIPLELRGLPSMTINTQYPTQGLISRGEHFIEDYEHLNDSLQTDLLPKIIGDYQFERALVGYSVIIPSDEELISLAASNSDKEFFTFELSTESLSVEWYEYSHLHKDNAVYTVHPTDYTGERSFFDNQVIDYEIIQLTHTEAILMNRDYMNYSDQGDGMTKDIIENNYQIIWQEGQTEYIVRPASSNRFYPDFKNRSEYAYPDNTRQDLIDLASDINLLLSK